MTVLQGGIVLILGSGLNATQAAHWPREKFDSIVAINNAWRIRSDWSDLIHPEDFPEHRRPQSIGKDQTVVDYTQYIPEKNRFGGVIYCGGTMAFTAGYWALGALRPRVIAFMGCDMTYPTTGNTHFYGIGAADPLRDDITLQNLESKSARLWFMAAEQGCLCVNLSSAPSRLLFPRSDVTELENLPRVTAPNPRLMAPAILRELKLNYCAPTGRYWNSLDQFNAAELAQIDTLWLDAWSSSSVAVA